MDKAESFVFYRSFSETAQLVKDEHDRLALYEALIHFGLDGEKPQLAYPLNAILEQMTASVKAAAERYTAAKENGERGGRPTKREYIPPEEWQSYLKDHSQKETAEHFGISDRTLRRWISVAEEKADKTGQNLNYNLNDNKNLNVNSNSNSNYQNKNKNNNASPQKTLKGVSAPRAGEPGFEWVKNGVRYRITEKREVLELGPEG